MIMLDKDKLHIIVYVNIKKIHEHDIPTYVEEVVSSVSKNNDGSVVYYFIPTTEDRENWMEFHWPPYIRDEERKLPYNLVEYIEENNINVNQ